MFQSSTTETKIAVLEERLSVYEQMMNRIDAAIEKISQTNQSISKMLAIHNEKIEQCGKTDDVMISMMEEMKKESKNHYDRLKKELNERLDNVEKKVEQVSQIKWMVVGMGVLAAIFVTAITQLAGGILTPNQTPPTIERAK